jgi:penicillin-binding protein 1A
MALPIWALYMKRLYADNSLKITQNDRFELPHKPLSVDMDCSKTGSGQHSINFDIP